MRARSYSPSIQSAIPGPRSITSRGALLRLESHSPICPLVILSEGGSSLFRYSTVDSAVPPWNLPKEVAYGGAFYGGGWRHLMMFGGDSIQKWLAIYCCPPGDVSVRDFQSVHFYGWSDGEHVLAAYEFMVGLVPNPAEIVLAMLSSRVQQRVSRLPG